MPGSVSYKTYLMEILRNPEEAAAYLNAVLEEGDLDMFLMALRNVAEACEVTESTEKSLHDLLSQSKDQVELGKVLALLDEMGFQINISLRTAA